MILTTQAAHEAGSAAGASSQDWQEARLHPFCIVREPNLKLPKQVWLFQAHKDEPCRFKVEVKDAETDFELNVDLGCNEENGGRVTYTMTVSWTAFYFGRLHKQVKRKNAASLPLLK